MTNMSNDTTSDLSSGESDVEVFDLTEGTEAGDVSEDPEGDAIDQDADHPWNRPGRWYVVHTQAGYEKKVRANLLARIVSMDMEERIFEVVIPMEEVVEFKGGKKQVVQKKFVASSTTRAGTACATRPASPVSSARASAARSRRPSRDARSTPSCRPRPTISRPPAAASRSSSTRWERAFA
jgi:hypothetical protein